jgi:hypothetical protein
MQEAQSPHQVEAEFGRQGIALIEGGQDLATRLADAGIIHGDHQQGVATKTSSLLQDGLEQILRFPTGAAVQLVVCAPIPILAAERP